MVLLLIRVDSVEGCIREDSFLEWYIIVIMESYKAQEVFNICPRSLYYVSKKSLHYAQEVFTICPRSLYYVSKKSLLYVLEVFTICPRILVKTKNRENIVPRTKGSQFY